jgi:hypothetical protein
MMKNLAFFFLSALAISASARDVSFTKKVDPGSLQKDLEAAGFMVRSITCTGGNHCTIKLPDSENRNPMPIVSSYVYVDSEAIREQGRREAEALYSKLKAKTLSTGERDRLLELLTQRAFGL